METGGNEVVKDVDPQGFLLNDNDCGVDHLGEFTFADALSDSIHQVDTPITIGLFARWGTGKSFLLRHIENILLKYQKQGEIDDANKERYQEASCKSSSVWKAFWLIVFLLFIPLFMLFTLLLAINPSIVKFLLPPEKIATNYSNLTSPPVTTNVPTLEGHAYYYSIIQIIALIMLPIEILLVFFVTCCGEKWTSGKYYGSFRLLCYGAFTKLPIRLADSHFVGDPGQRPAAVLRHIKPGNERLALAAADSVVLTRRYIFVDFRAWEYAGSDTLWAGIVTNLSDAIEKEFGVITARLFRMLSVQEIRKNVLLKIKRNLFVELPKNSTKRQVQDMMKQYGVVTNCKKIGDMKGSENSTYWEVTYKTDGEYRCALECLAIEDFKIYAEDPTLPEKKEDKRQFIRYARIRESDRSLIGSHIKMKDLGKKSKKQFNKEIDDHSPLLDRLKMPAKSCCCNRFCLHFLKYPIKVCCFPRLFWWILLLICCLFIPISIYIIADYLQLATYKTFRPVPIAAQVLLWLPGSLGVVVVGTKFIWAMCHSQRSRINRALDGTKNKMANELGFMNKVKNEISVISKLIQCARFTHQYDYKVVITIDDLDRVPLDKVKSVLEAVSILLSDRSSPFICLIAVDPRIVVKCIEQNMGEALLKANVTGHEYLKKIINLPVCLPEIGDSGKKRFIAGLIDQADHTITYREEIKRSVKENETHKNEKLSTEKHLGLPNSLFVSADDRRIIKEQRDDDEVDATRENSFTELVGEASSSADIPIQSNGGNDTELDDKTFFFECRNFMYNDTELHKYLQGNPRNIKRIFNVISLTVCIINCLVKRQQRRQFIQYVTETTRPSENPRPQNVQRLIRTKAFSQNLVRWIILADQWPYRTSYILQVIEDAEQRGNAGIEEEEIPKTWSILDIFQQKVETELRNDNHNMLSLDGDPDMFFSYLKLLQKCNFNKDKIRELEKYTVNLDHSLRHNISFDRDLSFMKAPDDNAKESDDSDKKENTQSNKKSEAHHSEEVIKIKNTTKTTKDEMEGKTVGLEHRASGHLIFADDNPNYPYPRNALVQVHSNI